MFPHSRRIVRAEVADGHQNELECDRNDVRDRDEAPHEPALQPILKCQRDVQEENRRHQVERLSKSAQDVSARPDQRRKEVDEPGDDSTCGPPVKWGQAVQTQRAVSPRLAP